MRKAMSTKFHHALSLACAGGLLLAACGKETPVAAPPQGPYVAAVPAAPAANPPAAPAASDAVSRRMLEGWIGAWNAHDPERASALLAEDVEYFDAGFYGIQHGREAAMDRGFEVFLRGVPVMTGSFCGRRRLRAIACTNRG